MHRPNVNIDKQFVGQMVQYLHELLSPSRFPCKGKTISKMNMYF